MKKVSVYLRHYVKFHITIVYYHFIISQQSDKRDKKKIKITKKYRKNEVYGMIE